MNQRLDDFIDLTDFTGDDLEKALDTAEQNTARKRPLEVEDQNDVLVFPNSFQRTPIVDLTSQYQPRTTTTLPTSRTESSSPAFIDLSSSRASSISDDSRNSHTSHLGTHQRPIVQSTSTAVPSQIHQSGKILYGTFHARVIPVSSAQQDDIYGHVPATIPVLLSRDQSQLDKSVIWVYNSTTKHPIGFVDKVSASALCRFYDDQKIAAQIGFHANMLRSLIPRAPSCSLEVMFYGPAQHADVLRYMLGNYGLQLVYPANELGGFPSAPSFGSSYMPFNFNIPDYTVRNNENASDVTNRQIDILLSSLTPKFDLQEVSTSDMVKTALHPHQKLALGFMMERERDHDVDDPKGTLSIMWKKVPGSDAYQNLFTNSISHSMPSEAKGGILADEMGLGKTLTTLSLICTADETTRTEQELHIENVSEESNTIFVKATLLICPPSVISNWEDQIRQHVPDMVDGRYYIHHGPSRISDPKLLQKYDLVISTYSTVSMDYTKEKNEKERDTPSDSPFKSALHSVHWHRVVLDEAHTIKTITTAQAQACFALQAHRRWCLTGTPLQNKLDDLFALMHFLRLEPFSERQWWQTFVARTMTSDGGVRRLAKFLPFVTLRRTKKQVIDGKPIVELPPRVDTIIEVELSEQERKVYDLVLARGRAIFKALDDHGAVLKNFAQILEILLRLRQVCSHMGMLNAEKLESWVASDSLPLELTPPSSVDPSPSVPEESAATSFETFSQESAWRLFKVYQATGNDKCSVCGENVSDASTDDPEIIVVYVTRCRHLICRYCIPDLQSDCLSCAAPLIAGDVVLLDSSMPLSRPQSPQKPSPSLETDHEQQQQHDNAPIPRPTIDPNPLLSNLRDFISSQTPSSKLTFLISDLTRLSVSSPTTKSVVFSQWTSFLSLIQSSLSRASIAWCRLDGSMSLSKREEVLNSFKKRDDVKVLLISLKAGGVGLNLTCARRVYLMDPWWNPSVENQAIDRIHRIGQTAQVECIRVIVKKSIEEKIIELQQKKASLAKLALNENEEWDNDDEAEEGGGGGEGGKVKRRERGRFMKEQKKEMQKIKLDDLRYLFKNEE